jgi:LPXTG-site transpeptidase (sortase) family protein
MTDRQSTRRRRHRRSSPVQRVTRFLGLGQSRVRPTILVLALAIAAAAVAVSLSGGTPPDGVAAIPSTSPSNRPPSTATLPAIATPSARLTPSPQPEGIVARRIQITRLGIDLRIVEGDGIDAPLDKAAHYPGSGWPDGGTNIYIYAHAQKGMFLSLWDAEVGDEVVLDLVDGTSRRYIVTQVLPRIPWNALKYLGPTPTEQLSLQTSTSYTPTAPRFLVIAEPAA